MTFSSKVHQPKARRPSRLRLLAAIAGAGLCLPAWAAGAERLRIDLPAHAQVKDAEVLLGEVARISGAALPLQVRLGNVLLGRMPRTGGSLVLERDALARWVRQQTGLEEEEIRWTGAAAVEVSWPRHLLPGDKVALFAKQGLLQWLAGRSERAEVECLTEVADLQLSAAEADAQLKLRPITDAFPRQRMQAWVDVYAGGRFLRAVPVSFKVDAWKTLPVAAQAVQTGAQLSADSLPSREVNLAQLAPRDAAAAAAAQPMAFDQPMRLRRAVRPGEPVTTAHFETLPAVQRGEWAVLRSGAGAVALESRVLVDQDARVGQSIRVKPAQSTSFVWARVKGPQLLELAQ